MENDTINIFRKFLDDSDNILKDIRIEVFKKLDLGRYEQLNEFVKESLEYFSFNISESDFFKQIGDVVIEQIDHIGTVDYNLLADNLASELKKIGQVDFNFDDDFRNLAKNINNKFPLIASDDWYARLNSKKEEIISMINKYNQNIVETLIKLTPKLASELQALESKAKSNLNDNKTLQQSTQQKNEQQKTLSPQQTEQVLVDQEKKIKEELVQQIISAMNKAGEMKWGDIDINERISRMNNIRNRLYIKSVEDLQTLLSTYQTEKKENVSTQDSVKSNTTNEVHQVESTSEIHSNKSSVEKSGRSEQSTIQPQNSELIDNLLAKCGEIYREISSKFVNSNDSRFKRDISKGLKQMEKFILNLKDQTFAREVFERYSKLYNASQQIIYDDIIFQNVPMLKGMYENSSNLTNEEKRPNKSEPKSPDPVETYIGATNEDVEKLIKQNKYYQLLQSIKKEDVMKYNGFIYTGYSILVDDWYARANVCKTYEEQRNAYFELYEIYQNFRDYISLEKSNELREQLDKIEKYLRKHAPTLSEDGVRYNDRRNNRNQEQSVMHR